MPFTDFIPGLFRKADPEPTTPAPASLTDPLASWLFGARPTYSSISVTPKMAMQVPAVALAVQTIANAVGGLPVKLYVRNGKGKEAAPAHSAFTLAHDEANPWTSAAELRAQLTRDALLHDNGGFALAVRGGAGRKRLCGVRLATACTRRNSVCRRRDDRRRLDDGRSVVDPPGPARGVPQRPQGGLECRAVSLTGSSGGAERARKWAMCIWFGIYEGTKPPRGFFDAPAQPAKVTPDQWNLVDREVRRFRKTLTHRGD